MSTRRKGHSPEAQDAHRRHEMKTPEDVGAIVRLHGLGWGSKRIAQELGIARNTVKRYIRQGGWEAYKQPERAGQLAGEEGWLKTKFLEHRGNAVVVKRELSAAGGPAVSLRTVQRSVEGLRSELVAEAVATVRFETRPGWQLQADFGQATVLIGGEETPVHLAVLTLGYSRRLFVCAWPCERQAQWLLSFERAFEHFGGVPELLLLDNPRALVLQHDRSTREVTFHPSLVAFGKHWGVRLQACAPYRARTKGKVERGVGYVKHNALAGYTFETWEAFDAHLVAWMREVSDVRIHGTTGERPIDRFEAAERQALKPLASRPSFLRRRTLIRRVQSDCCVEVDTNHYSVPWLHIGKQVLVDVVGPQLTVRLGTRPIAEHTGVAGRRRWVVDPRHMEGIVRPEALPLAPPSTPAPEAEPELLRPLSVYEQAAGGCA